MARILVVEDDADLQHLLGAALFKAEFEVHYAFSGREGYEKILQLQPDLILLDLMLPELSGVDVLKMVVENSQIRDIPVVIMTAYGDRQQLLERSLKLQGAAAYLEKPFLPREAVALVKRVLRSAPERKPEPIEWLRKGAVSLDPRFRTVWIHDQRVATLPPKRADLLAALLKAGGVVPRAALLKAVWGAEGTENLLEKTIQRLREDLGAEEGERIQTRPDGYELLG